MRRATAGLLLGFALTTFPEIARAGETDGAYGRLDGDLLLQGGAGIALALGGPQLAFDARALYLSTAGIYVRYTDACGQKNTAFERDIGLGVDVRPLFLGRWAQDKEKGPPRFDLLVDSLSFQFGAAWQEKQGLAFATLPAFEIGIGLEFPLLAHASGPYIGMEGLARIDGLDTTIHHDILAQGSLFLFTFSWHQMVKVGLSDFKDRR
jgi:hypothetical protein